MTGAVKRSGQEGKDESVNGMEKGVGEEILRHFREWYGPQEGMRVYLTVIPGIMADFNRMLERRPGEMVTEEYRLEDGKGAVVLSGWKRADGTTQVRAECRR